MARRGRDVAAGLDRAYRARCDMQTLREAADIQKDKARLKAAQAEARKQMAALENVAGGAKKQARQRKLTGVKL